MPHRYVEVAFPIAGVVKRTGYQYQRPYTTPDALNVRPESTLELRERGGTRPGTDRAMWFDDGDVSSQIQFINAVSFAQDGGWLSWGDDFHGSALGSAWNTNPASTPPASGSWNTPAISDRRLVTDSGSQIICVCTSATNSELFSQRVLNGRDNVWEIFISPYSAMHGGIYKIYCRMNTTTPALATNGVVVTLNLYGASSAAASATPTPSGNIIEYISGTPATTVFDNQSAMAYAGGGWFSVYLDYSTRTLKAYWRGTLLKSHVLTDTDPDGRAFGFGTQCTASGSKTVIDRFRISYYDTANLETRRTIITARDQEVYREDWPGTLVSVKDDALSALGQVRTAEYFQKLYMADYGPIVTDSDSGELSGDGTSLSDTGSNFAGFVTLGVDLDKHVVEIVAPDGSDTINSGSYRIRAVAEDELTIDSGAGSGGPFAYRVVVAPKVYSHGPTDNPALYEGTGVIDGGGGVLRDFTVDNWTGVTPGTHSVRLFNAPDPDVREGEYGITAALPKIVRVAATDGYVINGDENSVLVGPSITAEVASSIPTAEAAEIEGHDVVQLIAKPSTVVSRTSSNGRLDAFGGRIRDTGGTPTGWSDIISTDSIAISNRGHGDDHTAEAAPYTTGDFVHIYADDSAVTFGTSGGNDYIAITGMTGAQFDVLMPAGSHGIRFAATNGNNTVTTTITRASQKWTSVGDPDEHRILVTDNSYSGTLAAVVVYTASVSYIPVHPNATVPVSPTGVLRSTTCDYLVAHTYEQIRSGLWNVDYASSYDLLGTDAAPESVATVASGSGTFTDTGHNNASAAPWDTLGIIANLAKIKIIAGSSGQNGNSFLITAVGDNLTVANTTWTNASDVTYKIYYDNAIYFDPDGATGQGYVEHTVYKPATLSFEAPLPGGEGPTRYEIRLAEVQDGHSVVLHTADFYEDGLPKGQVPTGCKMVCIYKDRLVYARPSDFPHLWYMSRQGEPNDFDLTKIADDDRAAAVAGSVTDAGRLPQPIEALIPHTDDLLIFGCKSSLYILKGDPGQGGFIDVLSQNIGVAGAAAWCWSPDGDLIFLSQDGVYVVPAGGGPPVPFSRERLPAELMMVDPMTHTVTMFFDIAAGGAHLIISTIGQTRRLSYFIDWSSKSFWPYSLPESQEPRCAFDNDGQIYLGGKDGVIREFHRGHVTDGGTAIPWNLDLGPFKLGRSEFTRGFLKHLSCTLASGGGTASWSLFSGDTAEGVMSGTATATGTFRAGKSLRVSPMVSGGSVRLRLYGASISNHVSIETLGMTIQDTGSHLLMA